MTNREIDATDIKILRILQNNADCSMEELASRIGLTHTPCWRRYNRLKEMGYIQRQTVLIDPKLTGITVTAICDIRLKQHREELLLAFEEAVMSLPEVVACFATTGSTDYRLRVAVANLGDYERFFKQKLLRLPGVATVRTNFAFNTVKWTTALPL